MPSKQVAKRTRTGAKKKGRCANLEAARHALQAKRTAPSTPPSSSVQPGVSPLPPSSSSTHPGTFSSPPSSAQSQVPLTESASKRKLSFFSTDDCHSSTAPSYIFKKFAVLFSLFSQFSRWAICSHRLSLSTDPKKRHGFAFNLRVSCDHYGTVFTEVQTSPKSSPHVFDVNRRVVPSCLNAGIGLASLEALCESMGMACMSCATFNSHLTAIHKAVP